MTIGEKSIPAGLRILFSRALNKLEIHRRSRGPNPLSLFLSLFEVSPLERIEEKREKQAWYTRGEITE